VITHQRCSQLQLWHDFRVLDVLFDDELLCRNPEVGVVWSRSNNQQSQLCTSSVSAARLRVHGWNTEVVGHEWWRQHDKDPENQLYGILWLSLVSWCNSARNSRQLSFCKYYMSSSRL